MIADSPLIGKIILILVLIAIDAFCSCAEIAVISLDASELEKMAEEKNKKAERLLKTAGEISDHDPGGDHTVRISDQCLYGRSACTVDDRSCDGAVYTPGFGKSLA